MGARDWTNGDLLAVLDIGKTHAKLILLDPLDGAEHHVSRHRNIGLPGPPVRQLDLAGLTGFFTGALAHLPDRQRIKAIVPVAHGAACVMLDRDGNPVLAPDYEDPSLAGDPAYDNQRDPFTATFSPPLPAGLNLGRQIHHAQTAHPALFARVAAILTYPQYWAFFLSGVAASEATSLGCHTDLWLPAERDFSPLARHRGWADLFAPVRQASETLGPIRPDLARSCGLPPDCRILCGIHDSNASYLQHRASRARNEPFAVVSSGTWTIVMATGAPLERLDPARDMLANVDAFGVPVATARFMGGRDYAAIAAAHDEERASQHVAERTADALEGLGAAGDIVIDGPLARNPLFPGLLAALRPASKVWRARAATGPGGGACCLLLGDAAPSPVLDAA